MMFGTNITKISRLGAIMLTFVSESGIGRTDTPLSKRVRNEKES
jgi:hypothetical protein